MINNANNGDGGQNQQPANVQISAKEFAAKFKSKRGKYLPFRIPSTHAARSPLFGDGLIEWQVTAGFNLFRRQSSDSHLFFFHLEAYNFLAGECQVYLPPYGKSSFLPSLTVRSLQTTPLSISSKTC
jgi:hypothetical protein